MNLSYFLLKLLSLHGLLFISVLKSQVAACVPDKEIPPVINLINPVCLTNFTCAS